SSHETLLRQRKHSCSSGQHLNDVSLTPSWAASYELAKRKTRTRTQNPCTFRRITPLLTSPEEYDGLENPRRTITQSEGKSHFETSFAVHAERLPFRENVKSQPCTRF